MHMRIYWDKVLPGSWPAIEATYRDLVGIPVPGLVARFVARDVSDSDTMFTVTLWDSLESIRRWEDSEAYRTLHQAAVLPHLAGSRSLSLSEVRVFGGSLAEGSKSPE